MNLKRNSIVTKACVCVQSNLHHACLQCIFLILWQYKKRIARICVIHGIALSLVFANKNKKRQPLMSAKDNVNLVVKHCTSLRIYVLMCCWFAAWCGVFFMSKHKKNSSHTFTHFSLLKTNFFNCLKVCICQQIKSLKHDCLSQIARHDTASVVIQ